MIHFATDPELYVPLQTGWHWLLTPVKGEVVVNGWNGPATTPWFDLHLATGLYLDLRVILIDILVLVIFFGILPSVLSSAKRRRPISLLSISAGVAFGLIVGLLSYTSNPGLSSVVPLMIWAFTLVAALIATTAYKPWGKIAH